MVLKLKSQVSHVIPSQFYLGQPKISNLRKGKTLLQKKMEESSKRATEERTDICSGHAIDVVHTVHTNKIKHYTTM